MNIGVFVYKEMETSPHWVRCQTIFFDFKIVVCWDQTPL